MVFGRGSWSEYDLTLFIDAPGLPNEVLMPDRARFVRVDDVPSLEVANQISKAMGGRDVVLGKGNDFQLKFGSAMKEKARTATPTEFMDWYSQLDWPLLKAYRRRDAMSYFTYCILSESDAAREARYQFEVPERVTYKEALYDGSLNLLTDIKRSEGTVSVEIYAGEGLEEAQKLVSVMGLALPVVDQRVPTDEEIVSVLDVKGFTEAQIVAQLGWDEQRVRKSLVRLRFWRKRAQSVDPMSNTV